VNFHVKQFGDQYKVQSELRKLLFKRLQREKISMPFPTKTLLLEDNRTPSPVAPIRDHQTNNSPPSEPRT
jgi:small-conductance mechanosensitive channel